ncbi:MAG: DUF819 domain-containing protein [Bacteroidia bacterium]
MLTILLSDVQPLITNDAVVLGILMAILGLVFYTESLKSFEKFYKIIPSLLLCYFIPAILNTFDIISGHSSKLYFVASRYILPASIILLCISTYLKGIFKLGPKALIMFFSGTFGIIIGGPIALYTVSFFAPEILSNNEMGDTWRGLSTIAGSWIGGGANMTAMKEISGTSTQLFSVMAIIDVVCANIYMAFLLYSISKKDKINKFFKADASSIESLKDKIQTYQISMKRIPTTTSLMIMFAVVFAFVGLSHYFSDIISPGIESHITEKLANDKNSFWQYLTSLGSSFFWLVSFATIFGVALSFTKAKKFEGIGASKFGSIFLYFLIATIGMEMNFLEIFKNWEALKYLFVVGFMWLTIHFLILVIVAKIIKAPYFFLAIGSMSNVGGAASAPVVASAFHPSLASVAVLTAVLGYAIGTFGAYICMILLQLCCN